MFNTVNDLLFSLELLPGLSSPVAFRSVSVPCPNVPRKNVVSRHFTFYVCNQMQQCVSYSHGPYLLQFYFKKLHLLDRHNYRPDRQAHSYIKQGSHVLHAFFYSYHNLTPKVISSNPFLRPLLNNKLFLLRFNTELMLHKFLTQSVRFTHLFKPQIHFLHTCC